MSKLPQDLTVMSRTRGTCRVNPLPHHPSPSQHPGPIPMLGSRREDGCGKEMGLRPGAKQAPLLGKLLP